MLLVSSCNRGQVVKIERRK